MGIVEIASREDHRVAVQRRLRDGSRLHFLDPTTVAGIALHHFSSDGAT